MDKSVLQHKIIMEKPKGIQRNFQRLVFYMQNVGEKKTRRNKVIPIQNKKSTK